MQRLVALIRAVRRRTTDDRGAILIFTALGLVAFMAFAAVAVDLSALFVTRRHAQTVVDIGVLAGAQFAGVDSDPAVAKLAIIDEVKAITATNLGLTVLESDAAWAACVDPAKPLEFSPLAGQTPCISFTFGLTKIRVRLPDQTLNTSFAGVIGVDTLTTSASAEVEASNLKNGNILPFGVPTGDAESTLGCPSDHPNGVFPCDGPDSGNFNRLQILQWGTNPPLPVNDCTHSNGMFEDNIADGIDHPLGIWPTNPGVDDKPTCEDPNVVEPPGTVESNTGVAQSTLAPGLITGNTGGSGFDGRLTDTVPSWPTTTVLSETVDNRPLWEFIGVFGIGTAPANCQASSFTAGGTFDWDEDLWVSLGLDPITDDPDYVVGDPTSHLELAATFEHMARCLREYGLGVWQEGTGPLGTPPYEGAGYSGTAFTGVLFDSDSEVTAAQKDRGVYDLQLSPRWGWSPVGNFSTGVSPFQITDYIPIYINTLVANCNAHTCNWFWHAGQNPTSGSPQAGKIASMISFQLPESSVPATVFEFGPSSESDTEYTLTK